MAQRQGLVQQQRGGTDGEHDAVVNGYEDGLSSLGEYLTTRYQEIKDGERLDKDDTLLYATTEEMMTDLGKESN